MLVELTDKEVRMVGEQRWLWRKWGWKALAFALVCVWTVALAYAMPEPTEIWSTLLRVVIQIAFPVMYYVWLIKRMSKAGRRFLENTQT